MKQSSDLTGSIAKQSSYATQCTGEHGLITMRPEIFNSCKTEDKIKAQYSSLIIRQIRTNHQEANTINQLSQMNDPGAVDDEARKLG